VGYRRADTRDYRIEAFQRLASIVNRGFVCRNIHVGAQHIDNDDFVAALLGGLDDTARRVEFPISRKKCDFH
jgi:hypothetical protein